MGTIKNDIVTFFLPQYPDQEALLKPFLYGFDVSYAEKKTLNNTTLYVYLLKRLNHSLICCFYLYLGMMRYSKILVEGDSTNKILIDYICNKE